MRIDAEVAEFRDIMKAPSEFEDSFGWGTVLMAMFVGLIMAPTQLYMGLVAGVGAGGAAQWVTIILYVEVSRRAFKQLKRPELFLLSYMCGTMMGLGSTGLLWSQFVVQSEQMHRMGITSFPSWYAPSDLAVLGRRSFFLAPWMVPLGLGLMGGVIGRLDHFGLGYIMYRLTSDVEKLPFPMAPVGAMGITALADASGRKDTWRWRIFSNGAMAGLGWGFIYLAIPNVTAALLARPIRIIPIPFVDLTRYTEEILPAMPMLVSLNIGVFIAGMVMPFWAMMGSLAGLIITLVANPILYQVGILSGWERGVGGIQTTMSNTMDFYFSFSIGLAMAVAAIGFYHVVISLRQKRADMDEAGAQRIEWSRLFKAPPGRGDIPIWIAAVIYVSSTTIYVCLSYYLINHASGPLEGSAFPLWILIFYGFIYTPVISYVSARMEGMVGRQVGIPYLREATFILSGYKGAAIWLAPIPMHNYAGQVMHFRVTELTGTKFTALIKAEILAFPVVFMGALLFQQFIWSMAPVPSQMFPYANEFWELNAYGQALMWSATMPGGAVSPFQEALRPEYIGAAFVLGTGLFTVLNYFGLPIFLVYGLIRGLDQTSPGGIIPMVIGAFVGRFIFRKRFGKQWPQIRVVFSAGFGCGMGLITMVSLGFVLMAKSAIKLPV